MGQDISILFDITVKPGTTVDQLISELKNISIGTGDIGPDGNLRNRVLVGVNSVSVQRAPAGAPTLSQWGVIIMALLLLTVGVSFITRRQLEMVGAFGFDSSELNASMNMPLFAPSVYSKAFTVTLALMIVGLVVMVWLYGSISMLDICGALLCALICAYIIHLLTIGARHHSQIDNFKTVSDRDRDRTPD